MAVMAVMEVYGGHLGTVAGGGSLWWDDEARSCFHAVCGKTSCYSL